MRVALVLGTSAGGVGRHVHDLTTGLVDGGHDVLVACPDAVEEHFGFSAAGARHVALAVSDRPHPVRDAAAVATLRRILRGADVVHAHGLRAGALLVLAATGVPTPVVVTLHNATPGGRLGAVYAVLERVVARGADLVLGVSADLVERQEQLGAAATALAVVAAPRPGRTRQDRTAVRAELGLDDDTPLAVVVARLAPQKGLDLLLDALVLLVDRVEVLVVVAGDGPLREHLAARAAEDDVALLLLGQRDDVPDLLAAADLVVSSALWEGQPVGLQEALHAGAPIVATDAGGTAAVLGGAGIIVANHDPQALADAVADVLGSPDLTVDLRERARARAAELPTRADAVADAVAAYRRVRKGPGASET
jgi:glycosyltransferase involved in cell wall biosynthesis